MPGVDAGMVVDAAHAQRCARHVELVRDMDAVPDAGRRHIRRSRVMWSSMLGAGDINRIVRGAPAWTRWEVALMPLARAAHTARKRRPATLEEHTGCAGWCCSSSWGVLPLRHSGRLFAYAFYHYTVDSPPSYKVEQIRRLRRGKAVTPGGVTCSRFSRGHHG